MLGDRGGAERVRVDGDLGDVPGEVADGRAGLGAGVWPRSLPESGAERVIRRVPLVDLAGERASLLRPVQVERLAVPAAGEDGVMPAAVIDGAIANDGVGGARPEFPVELAVRPDVQGGDMVVAIAAAEHHRDGRWRAAGARQVPDDPGGRDRRGDPDRALDV